MYQKKNTFDNASLFEDILQESIDIHSLFINKSNHSSIELIQKFFQKNLKLRNVSKQILWNRNVQHTNRYLLQATDLLPKIIYSQSLLSSIERYINNESSILLGKITQESSSPIYSSITDPQNDTNVMINPRLICNKDEKKEKIMSLIEVAYNQLNKQQEQHNINKHDSKQNEFACSHNIFIFNREEEFDSRQKNINSFLCKIYTILPNVNFDLKQIKNLSFSQTQLNKYLVKAEYENEAFDPKQQLRSGFLTMSQEHRLICLKDDTLSKGKIKHSQSLKHIIVGIWLNLKDEHPTPKKKNLDILLKKHMGLIYQKCFDYIQMTSHIDSVYSPSPDQGIFLLVIFYKTIQCHYEVTIIPNEEDKCISVQNVEESHLFAQGYSPNWLIVKNKYCIKPNGVNDLQYDLSKEISKGRVMTMSDYISKKTGLNPISFLTKSTNTRITTPSKLSSANYFKDNLHEIFDHTDLEIDDMEDLYNLPLIMPTNFKLKKDMSNINSGTCSINRYGQLDKEKEENNDNNKSIDLFNKKDSTLGIMLTKSNEEVSRASTNHHSHKISSVGSSCRASLNRTSNSNCFMANQYTTIIMQQAETIKNLQNKVSLLESNIKSVLSELIGEDYDTTNSNGYANNNQGDYNKSKEDAKLKQIQEQLQYQYQQKINNEKRQLYLQEQNTLRKMSRKKLFESYPNFTEQENSINGIQSHDISIKIPCIKYNKSMLSEDGIDNAEEEE